MRSSLGIGIRAVALAAVCGAAQAQLAGTALPLDHPSIAYGASAADRVAELQQRIEQGAVRLELVPGTGYLRSLLDALEVPIESQIVVFSKTSLQARLIDPRNPRAIYFNDSVFVAWMRGGFIEVAAHEPRQGATFYVLQQTAAPIPRLQPDQRCLGCHYSNTALGVPGFLVRSVPTAVDGTILPWLGNTVPDHATPLEERWGGWYVTGRVRPAAHLGNTPLQDKRAQDLPDSAAPVLTDLTGQFDTRDYLTPHSDVAALLVFDHQVRMMNILTRLGWDARIAAAEGRPLSTLDKSVEEAVDYLLFVDEAPLGAVESLSGFAEQFAARGPRDRSGRSLRDLRLSVRIMRYPCSYMIYSDAFEALPSTVKDRVYRRLWAVLSGAEQHTRYERLGEADRKAVVEILVDTKAGLPDYFRPLSQ